MATGTNIKGERKDNVSRWNVCGVKVTRYGDTRARGGEEARRKKAVVSVSDYSDIREVCFSIFVTKHATETCSSHVLTVQRVVA